MEVVTIKREALLEILKSNRERHIENVKAAEHGRREQAKQQLRDLLIRLNHPYHFELPEHITFPQNVDNTSDYDRAIRMVELEVEEVITLQPYTFNQWVMDEWDWQPDFLRTATAYVGAAVKKGD